MSIQVGDTLPSMLLQEGSPGNTVDIQALFANKRGILFGVPGAFTPDCNDVHLPGYIENAEALAQKGIELIVCVAVNDSFVMGCWAKATGAEGKVRMLADPHAEFSKAIGVAAEASWLGGTRSTRYSMVIQNGVVESIHREPDGFGLDCSLAGKLVESL